MCFRSLEKENGGSGHHQLCTSSESDYLLEIKRCHIQNKKLTKRYLYGIFLSSSSVIWDMPPKEKKNKNTNRKPFKSFCSLSFRCNQPQFILSSDWSVSLWYITSEEILLFSVLLIVNPWWLHSWMTGVDKVQDWSLENSISGNDFFKVGHVAWPLWTLFFHLSNENNRIHS